MIYSLRRINNSHFAFSRGGPANLFSQDFAIRVDHGSGVSPQISHFADAGATAVLNEFAIRPGISALEIRNAARLIAARPQDTESEHRSVQ